MKNLFYVFTFMLIGVFASCNDHSLVVPASENVIVDQPFTISNFTYSTIKTNIGGRTQAVPVGQNHITFFRDAVDANNLNAITSYQTNYPIPTSNFSVDLTTSGTTYKWKDNDVVAYTNVLEYDGTFNGVKDLTNMQTIDLFNNTHIFSGKITLSVDSADYLMSMTVLTSELVFSTTVDSPYINDVDTIDVSFDFLPKNKTTFNDDLYDSDLAPESRVFVLTSTDKLNYSSVSATNLKEITLPGKISNINVKFKLNGSIVKTINYTDTTSVASNQKLTIILPQYTGSTVSGSINNTVSFNTTPLDNKIVNIIN